MLMATDFQKLRENNGVSSDIYYFDVDGAFLDTEKNSNPLHAEARIYAARAMIDAQNVRSSQRGISTIRIPWQSKR
jgi:hypothetical protein